MIFLMGHPGRWYNLTKRAITLVGTLEIFLKILSQLFGFNFYLLQHIDDGSHFHQFVSLLRSAILSAMKFSIVMPMNNFSTFRMSFW